MHLQTINYRKEMVVFSRNSAKEMKYLNTVRLSGRNSSSDPTASAHN